MDILIWVGTLISLAGLIGLVWCILWVVRARRAATDDDALRDIVRRAVPLNMGALFLSVIGLMLVMLGLFLG
jgi:hypothetical protein